MRIPAPLYLFLLSVFAFSLAPGAFAVRPFITDDARIVDQGQAELETWGEWQKAPGQGSFAQHLLVAVSPTDWAEILVRGGIGRSSTGEFSVANPVVQPKFLLRESQENGSPGFAVSLGLTLPYGQGVLFDNMTAGYAAGLATSQFFDDRFRVHLNFGGTLARQSGEPVQGRFFWGAGTDVALWRDDWRLVLEGYVTDPLRALGPGISGQMGVRWIKSDYFNCDVTVGAEPELDSNSNRTGKARVWVQLGIRLLADVFSG